VSDAADFELLLRQALIAQVRLGVLLGDVRSGDAILARKAVEDRVGKAEAQGPVVAQLTATDAEILVEAAPGT